MSDSSSRRAFLQRSSLSAAAIAASRRSFAASPNSEIRVGCIGTGGRMLALMRSLRNLPGVRIVSVCDLWDPRLAAAKLLADSKANAFKDHRRILDSKEVDAVVIATPDHWHAPMTISACQAGKDVYVEKPLTHSVSEGAAIIEAKNRAQRIVQVGTQQRSMPQFQAAKTLLDTGKLGVVHKVHLSWNRNQPRDLAAKPKAVHGVDWKQFLGTAPEQPFDPYRYLHWRWFWDFGGGILTDLMVHFIDVVHWFLDLDHPTTAVAVGDFAQAKGLWETPDTIQTLLHYPERNLQVHFEGTFVNARGGAMLEFLGTQGSLYLDRGRYEFRPERNQGKPEEMILGKGPKGADFYLEPDGERLHLENWISCVRSRKTPNAPVEAGVSAVHPAHLGNHAFRTGAVARWEDLIKG